MELGSPSLLKVLCGCVLALAAAGAALPAAEAEAANLMLVFDSSGSMKKAPDGEQRMQAAKEAVRATFGKLSPDTKVGLLAFGHRRAKDCTDMEVVVPLGAESAQSIINRVLAFKPLGETPIAASIQMAAANFADLKGQKNSILLVTDGVEECGGDPCAAARTLAAANFDLKVHIVGLSLDPTQRAAIDCLTKETGGMFFPAEKTSDLSDAVAAAVQIAQAEPEPAAPPPPIRERVFFDDFDQVDLSEDWDVLNSNPDAYIVESGSLLMINGQVTGFQDPNMQNLITLRKNLPHGDWDVELVATGEFKTGRDQVSLGLRKDEKDYLVADFWARRSGSGCSRIILSLVKSSGGQITRFDQPVRGTLSCNLGEDEFDEFAAQWLTKKFTLTLSKRGRNYFSSIAFDGEEKDGTPVVYTTNSLTSLRPPGALTFGLGRFSESESSGEVLLQIDSLEVLSVTPGG